MTWRVELDDRARRELRKLDKPVQGVILAYLRKRVATSENPRRFGKALVGNLAGLWRYRVGDYRLLCSIEDDKLLVLVLRTVHRKESYD